MVHIINGGHEMATGGDRAEVRAGLADETVCAGGASDSTSEAMLAELRKESDSKASKARSALIRSLAKALETFKGVKTSGDDEEIVASIRRALPAPGRGRVAGSDTESGRSEACLALATVLNKQFAPMGGKGQLINTKAGNQEICRQVIEFVDSLSTGMCAEFIKVKVAIGSLLSKLDIIDEHMQSLHAEAVSLLKGDPSEKDRAKAARLTQDYEEYKLTRDSVKARLKNYLRAAIKVSKEDLLLAYQDDDELAHTLKAGFDRGFLDALGKLGKLSVVAHQTKLLLEKLGVNLNEFRNADDTKKLRDLLDKLYSEQPPDKAASFLAASKALRALAGMPGLSRKELVGAIETDEMKGGDEDSEPRMSALDRRVKKEKMERKLLIGKYIEETGRDYDKLLAAVKKLGPQLGSKVPINDNIMKLQSAFKNLGKLSLEDVGLNLIGFYTSAAAREERSAFLNRLDLAKRALDDIIAGGGVGAFEEMRSAISDMVKTIERYTDIMAQRRGGDEADGEGAETEGGDAEAEAALAEAASQSTSRLTLQTAIRDLLYWIQVAQIKRNLSMSKEELHEYGKNYDTTILGDAIAGRREEVMDARDARLKNSVADGGIGTKPADAAAAKEWEATKKSIEEECKVKCQFYETLEAIDLYLKAFTAGAVANVEDVMNIARELDNIKMIAGWYEEDTGNDLAEFFDMTRSINGSTPDDVASVNIEAGEHYYSAVERARDVGAGGAVRASNIQPMRAKTGSMLARFQALKNLINAFVRLGAKFGGSRIISQTTLTPTEMFNGLMAYIKCSAVTTGLKMPPMGKPQHKGKDEAANAEEASRTGYPTPCCPDPADSHKSDWTTENEFFQLAIKSIAGKILVTLGIYDLFDNPEPKYTITPTRVILGGGDVEVIPEAAELYFRLPRLVEFYQQLFKFDPSKTQQITMLPDTDGVFSGLIKQIFVLSSEVAATGDYSSSEVERIVGEVNLIYDKFARGDRANGITKAINALVADINRRYGVIKKTEWEKWQALMAQNLGSGVGGPHSRNRTNFAILPEEEDDDAHGTMASPSEAYLRRRSGASGTGSFKWRPGEHNLSDPSDPDSMWHMISDFRQKISTELDGLGKTGADAGKVSYGSLIEQAKRDMERDAGNAARMEIAKRLIQGSSAVVSSDQGRALMFHETVVLGLNSLQAIYKTLDNFRQAIVKAQSGAIEAAIVAHIQSPGGIVDRPSVIAALSGANVQYKDRYIRPSGPSRLGTVVSRSVCSDGTDHIQMWTAIRAIATAQPKAAARAIVDRQAIMKDLLLNLFEIASDFSDMVSLRFPGTATLKISLEFGTLRETIQGLLKSVRERLNDFRGSFPKEVIDKYENAANEGSLYWLEKNLVDGMLRGFTDAAGREVSGNVTLDKISKLANDAMVALTTPGPQLTFTVAGAALAPADTVEQYGNVLAELVCWHNPVNTGSATFGSRTVNIGKLVAGQRNQDGSSNLPINSGGGAAVTNMPNTYDTVTGFNPAEKSMVFSFNQLLAMFLDSAIDPASAKIYSGFIDPLANGTFAQSVMIPGYAQPDMTAGAQGFGLRGVPTSSSVLFASLANVLQRLTKDKNRQGVSLHMATNLADPADVPLYVKESARANLPVFSKLFEILARQGEMLKQFIQKVGLGCERSDWVAMAGVADGNIANITGVGAVGNATPASWPAGSVRAGETLHPLPGATTTGDQVKSQLLDAIEGVNNGCYTLSQSCQKVLQELVDEPVYLQTSAGSIQEYRQRYGKEPLMPLSLLTTVLQDEPAGSLMAKFTPGKTTGTPDFKVLYGTRGILEPRRKLAMAEMPGVQSIVKAFNLSAGASEKIDESAYAQFAGAVVHTIRLISNIRYRALLTPSAGTFGGENLGLSGMPTANFTLKTPKKTPVQILEVVDSSYQEDKITEIAETVGDAGHPSRLGTNREAERMRNICDRNIMPINVHALMRSFALANVYNYGYSFEEMLCLMHGESREQIKSIDLAAAMGAPSAPKNTSQFFLALMLDPYAKVSHEQFGDDMRELGTGGFFHRICRGDNGMGGLGRPKFLSDQLFNKALFGSLYPSVYDWDESGPSRAGPIRRGREDWGRPGVGTKDAAAIALRTNMISQAIKTAEVALGGGAWDPDALKRIVGAAYTDLRATNFPDTDKEFLKGFNPKDRSDLKRLAKMNISSLLPDLSDGSTYLSNATTDHTVPPSNFNPGGKSGSTVLGSVVTYIGAPAKGDARGFSVVKQVGLGQVLKADVTNIGFERFNTSLVRNLTFISNIQRLVRNKLHRELATQRSVLQSGHGLINPALTEFGANGTNERVGDAPYNRDLSF